MPDDRLSEIAARRTDSWPGTKGYGHRAWETRRANQFQKAVTLLLRRKVSIDELQLAAHEVSEQIVHRWVAAGFGVELRPLPRGYSIVKNCSGELSLALDGALFGPSFGDPLPGQSAIERLTHDLGTGWLDELLGACL